MTRFDDEAKRRAENERRFRNLLQGFEHEKIQGYSHSALIEDEVGGDYRFFDIEAGDPASFNYRIYSNFDFGRPKEPSPADRITDQNPRAGFIDGGVIMKKGFTITKEMMQTMPREEWKAISDWVDSMANIVAEEIFPDQVYWVYDTTPVITTMAS
jgi:hypothetical protein